MNSKEYARNYYIKNKAKLLARQREYEIEASELIKYNKRNYYLKNKEKIQEKAKKYYSLNTDKMLKRTASNRKKRLKVDSKFKLSCQLRSRLYSALRSKKWLKNNSFRQYIGCDLEQLKTHIEKLFQSGMTWENHGEWHIDHIFPLAKANDEKHMYKLCHYTNLQPLWAEENFKKQDKLITKDC